MANGTFAAFRAAALSKQIDLLNDEIRCILIDTAVYSPNLNAHEFLSVVPAPARIVTSFPLTGKTVLAGTFRANDGQFPGTVGASAEGILIYQNTGIDATSRLISWLDTGGSGLPITPSGESITARWNAAGIFSWDNH